MSKPDQDAFQKWLEIAVDGMTHEVFGEPGVTPEQHVMEIEEIRIAVTGKNLCGVDLSDIAQELYERFFS